MAINLYDILLFLLSQNFFFPFFFCFLFSSFSSLSLFFFFLLFLLSPIFSSSRESRNQPTKPPGIPTSPSRRRTARARSRCRAWRRWTTTSNCSSLWRQTRWSNQTWTAAKSLLTKDFGPLQVVQSRFAQDKWSAIVTAQTPPFRTTSTAMAFSSP